MMSKSTHPSGGLKFEGTIFDGLGPEERQELEIEKKEFFHRKGEVIIQEGSSSSGVYCLIEGICKREFCVLRQGTGGIKILLATI